MCLCTLRIYLQLEKSDVMQCVIFMYFSLLVCVQIACCHAACACLPSCWGSCCCMFYIITKHLWMWVSEELTNHFGLDSTSKCCCCCCSLTWVLAIGWSNITIPTHTWKGSPLHTNYAKLYNLLCSYNVWSVQRPIFCHLSIMYTQCFCHSGDDTLKRAMLYLQCWSN